MEKYLRINLKNKMNIDPSVEEKQKLILSTIKELYAIDYEDPVVLERPKNSEHGDWTFVVFKLASKVGESPLDVSKKLSEKINSDLGTDSITSTTSFIGGFLNFKDKDDHLKKIVEDILNSKNFGKSDFGQNKKVMIEFGQPNTHKAFHIGHLKSAVSGLSMVKLQENLGYDVIKANYFGDVGMHVAKCTWGFLHTEVPESFDSMEVHERMKFIDGCYVKGSAAFKEDKKAEEEMRQINKDIYLKVDNLATQAYKKLREYSIEHQTEIWKTLGVTYDRQYPESEVYEEGVKIVQKYMGKIFEESEGAVIYRGEKVGLNNWVFLTKDGNPTYSAKDLALAYKKFEEYPDLFKGIVTTSVEQKDYFKAVIKVLELIDTKFTGRYEHIPFGWMLRSGKKFSSRMGETVKGMDILNEVKSVARQKVEEIAEYSEDEKESISSAVAMAGLKFLILSHEFHKDFSYDPDKFLSFDGYTGPYVLYSYARCKSILRKAEVTTTKAPTNLGEVLNAEAELNLLKKMDEYKEVAYKAGVEITPHIICNYLFELAESFNRFYNECRVIEAETELDKQARLALTEATSIVLKNGLNLLGIETVERM